MKLYALPTTHCNLNCPHCSIKNAPEDFNRERFINVLNSFEGSIILFGGEPTLHRERMFDIIEANKTGKHLIGAISTNLILLDEELIELYKKLKFINTSWNPQRFTPEEYTIWLSHCKQLKENDIEYRLMVTLTDDLLLMEPEAFIEKASEWDPSNISHLKLENYVGDVTPDYFQRVDDWLCQLYLKWKLPIRIELFDQIDNWKHNCDEVYTLFPDGTLVNSCPHRAKIQVPLECLTCERAAQCRPCKLQPFCSYPKKLAELIKEGVGVK